MKLLVLRQLELAGNSKDCGDSMKFQPVAKKKPFIEDLQKDITWLDLKINQLCGLGSPDTKVVFEDENGVIVGQKAIGLMAKSISY